MTSIEWLELELLNKRNGTPIIDKALFDRAKELNKQEIIDAYESRLGNNYNFELSGEQYYQETFKKD